MSVTYVTLRKFLFTTVGPAIFVDRSVALRKLTPHQPREAPSRATSGCGIAGRDESLAYTANL